MPSEGKEISQPGETTNELKEGAGKRPRRRGRTVRSDTSRAGDTSSASSKGSSAFDAMVRSSARAVVTRRPQISHRTRLFRLA